VNIFLAIVRLSALVGGIYGGVVLLRNIAPKMDGWKRAGAAFFCGLVVFSIVCQVTQTDAERRQEASQQEAQKAQAQAQEQHKIEKAKVAEKKESETAQEKLKINPKRRLSKAKIAEARTNVQRIIDEGIIMKVSDISDDGRFADVWTDAKFNLLPFDLKSGALDWVYLAYCSSTTDGYIRIIDGYTGKKIGEFTLRSGLEMNRERKS
jgi:hypothetical protein